MSYARRVDGNHTAVIGVLRQLGWYVLDVHHVPGFVDAILARGGRVVFAEIKDGNAKDKRQRTLRRNQTSLHADLTAAGAEVVVLMSVAEAEAL